jgi:hypothetical protein
MKSPTMDGGSPMENNPLVAENDNKSFISFLNKVNSTPLVSISGGDGDFMEEDEADPFALLQNGEQDLLTKSSKKGNGLFVSEKEDNPIDPFLKKDEVRPKESKKEDLPNEQGAPFMNSFLIELVHSIKNTLASIYHATVLTMEKYDDLEIRKRSHAQVKEDIKKIDSILNSVLNFININTPIIKRNTLKIILDEILEANEKQIQEKKIRIINKCEKDLPETFIHTEQVRYILNSVLQYALVSTPINGTIGFLIKSFDFQNGSPDKKALPERNGGYIEAAIAFTSHNVEQLKDVSGTPTIEKDETLKLILKLVKEILQKNHGMMAFEADQKKPRALITLRFPIERRKVIYYEPISI